MADTQKAIIYKGPGEFAYEERPVPEVNRGMMSKLKYMAVPSAARM